MNAPLTPAEEALREAALEYHRAPTRGKISITPTKPLSNQRDLSLAYSPGVAYASLAIKDDPLQAATLTTRANLVGVITNGTAVLGLGNIGPLAGKPVMEGKGCLFKKFAGIDVFDIEVSRPTRTNWWPSWRRSSQPSAASIWRTSRRRSASTSRRSCASGSTSRSSTTTSTARRSSRPRRC